MPFTFQRLTIPDVVLIKAQTFPDPRGLFVETYKRSAFEANGITPHFVQDNSSRSVRGTLRGLHYQLPPLAQAKLVWATRGEVFDVAVDLRKGSPTFGRAVTHTLSAEAHDMLFIPAGFAHGFCVLSESAEMQYKSSAEYSPAHERGIRWNDPQLNIPWPIREPLLSDKDRSQPLLADHPPVFE